MDKERDYKISLSYAFDKRTGYLGEHHDGERFQIEYGSFLYRDIKAPTKTYAKQLATYYLLNGNSLDEKLVCPFYSGPTEKSFSEQAERTRWAGPVNMQNDGGQYKKVGRMEIISIE